MKRKLKLILAPIIVIATIIGFIAYLSNNPQVVEQISDIPLSTLGALVLLYLGFVLALMGVLISSLAMYSRSVSRQESFYITAYSSIINFFGPGQSGPAVRAAYLKLKHGVSIKQYGLATLIYYGFYSLISGIIIAVAVLPWWLSSLVAIVATIACLLSIHLLRSRRSTKDNGEFRPIVMIAGFALLQTVIQTAIYFIELHSLGSQANLGQTLIYTGTANFALFVALTPGAIGFREAFLLFTQKLHDIPNDMIIAANVLDRAVYVVFLGLLFIIILTMRSQRRFAKLQATISKK